MSKLSSVEAHAGDRARFDPLVFRLRGLTCADSAAQFERVLESGPKVRRAELNYGAATLKVWGSIRPDEVIRRAGRAGYQAVPIGVAHGEAAARSSRRRPYRMWMTLLGGIALEVALAERFFGLGLSDAISHLLSLFGGIIEPGTMLEPPISYVQIILVLSILLSGFFPFRSAVFSLLRGRIEKNALLCVATVGAVLVGKWFEAATVMFLFSLSEIIVARCLDRARRPASRLVELAPEQATVLIDGQKDTVASAAVQPGDICLVLPGERIPVDGRVISGKATVTEALLTGEATPVAKAEGEPVYAGSVNEGEALQVQTDRAGDHTRLARIVQLVEEAKARKPPAQLFVDRFAKRFTLAIMVAAVVTAGLPPLVLGDAFAPWIYRGLVLLVLSSPSALVISLPVTIVSSLNNAVRTGLLVKDGATLKALAQVNSIAFSQTGILTKGHLEVTDVAPVGDWAKQAGADLNLLTMAAAVESHSPHPIGLAIVAAAADETEADMADLKAATAFRTFPGLGVEAHIDGKTWRVGNSRFFERLGIDLSEVRAKMFDLQAEGKNVVVVTQGLRTVGLIALADAPKQQSLRTLIRLKRIGRIDRTSVLTGVDDGAAKRLASELEIDTYRSGLLPEEKARHIADWRREGRHIAMVGDDEEDGPAMAEADVGIALGAIHSDNALDGADVAIMANDLTRLPYAFLLARRWVRISRQNVFLSIGLKAVALGLLATGHLTLWLVVAIDAGALLLVTFNGMRLLRRIRPPKGRLPRTPGSAVAVDGAQSGLH